MTPQEAVTWVFDNSWSKGAPRLVALALATHGGEVTITGARLEDWTKLSRRATQSATRQLAEFGELQVWNWPGRPNHYRMLTPERAPLPLPKAARYEPIPPEVRWFIYERDGWQCLTCHAIDDLTIDHIYPKSLGGPDTVDNLQTLCRSCNSRKGARVLWSGASSTPTCTTSPPSRPPKTRSTARDGS